MGLSIRNDTRYWLESVIMFLMTFESAISMLAELVHDNEV